MSITWAVTVWALWSAGWLEAPLPVSSDLPSTPRAVALARAAGAALQAGRIDEARRGFLAAAAAGPEAADWLRLRAAQLTPDSGARSRLYDQIQRPAARFRVPLTEALARERAGDWAGAGAGYESIDRPLDGLRMRIRSARTAAERGELRSALLAMVVARPVGERTIAAADLLAERFGPPTPTEALAIGRAAVAARLPGRAVVQFPIGLTSPLATPDDRLDYARSLLRTGRPREALTMAISLEADPHRVAAVALEGARAEIRLGERAAARTRLARGLERAGPDDSTAVSVALLLGELVWDDEGPAAARRIFDLAPRARHEESLSRLLFLAGLAAWAADQPERAVDDWSELRGRFPRTEMAAAAGYWSGRAWDRMGNPRRARVVWDSVRTADSLSYYAVASAERLGLPAWSPPSALDTFVGFTDLDETMGRMTVLGTMRLGPEVEWEREWLLDRAAESPERRLATANAFRTDGQLAFAARVARAALANGAPADGRTYRLIYPFPHREMVYRHAAEAGVDPFLVAALTRQESLWNPAARSLAGARGLMQLLPGTARPIARQLGLVKWTADQLDDPAINVRIGAIYLASTLRRCDGEVACALAAYNAGPGRAARWRADPSAADTDFFVERVAFAETRDYVRVVRRNLTLYRALYPLTD